ncbi:MAG: hypothetical protein ACYS32_06335 [Planctomycetota bacterium]|jgi:hypothetical protein
MGRNTFYILSCGFAFFTLIFAFSSRPLTSTKDYVRNYKQNMQNKANFRKSQMYATNLLTRDYDIMDTWWSGKKQSQTNPNKANLQNTQMNVNNILAKEYEQMDTWSSGKNEPKTNPIQTQNKPNLSWRSLWRRRKQTQFQRQKNADTFDD